MNFAPDRFSVSGILIWAPWTGALIRCQRAAVPINEIILAAASVDFELKNSRDLIRKAWSNASLREFR